jgi:hypothetical protein
MGNAQMLSNRRFLSYSHTHTLSISLAGCDANVLDTLRYFKYFYIYRFTNTNFSVSLDVKPKIHPAVAKAINKQKKTQYINCLFFFYM